jgi:hypothetical protein
MRTLVAGLQDCTESEDDRMTAAATAVLQHRLEGQLHRNAVVLVSASHSLNVDEVGRSWARKKRDALVALTIGRVVDACPWTEAEVRRLARIFARKDGFASPAGAIDQGPNQVKTGIPAARKA